MLDASFLDAPSAPSKPKRPAPKSAPRRPGAKPAARRAPAAKPAEPAEDTPPPQKNVSDWRSQVSEEDWKQNEVAEKPKFVADKAMDANEVMGSAKTYLLALSLADKLALGGAALLLASTFLPWAETAKRGDVLGILSIGFLVTLSAATAVTGVLVRTLKAVPKLNPLLPWVAQLGGVGIGGLWCLVFIVMYWDATLVPAPIGNFQVWASKPAFGVIIALLASITSIVGTVFGLKDMGK